MHAPRQIRVLVAAAVVVCAISMSAQRYYGRDHHVYHPPAPVKHPASQPASARAHAVSTTSASTAHNTSVAPYHVPASTSSAKPDVAMPPNTGERQPQ